MAYLKGVKCENCGDKLWINRYYEERERETYIDGATCRTCFKNIVLPDEEYHSFVREHGER